MSLFQKILLLLVIIGGLNWGIYGIPTLFMSKPPEHHEPGSP